MARAMANTNLWLVAIVVIGCAAELIQAAAIRPAVTSDGIPPNRVGYKRWVRRRPSPHDPTLDVYEVRHVYFVRRTTTPKPKPAIELSDDEMDRQIRCDFQPSLAECNTPGNGPTRTTRTPTTTTTSTTSTTTTTPQPPPPPTTTQSSTTSTSDLPFLPILPEETSTTSTTTTTITTEPSGAVEGATEEEYRLPLEDTYDDVDEDFGDEEDDEDHKDDDYYTTTGSIGGNDIGVDPVWNTEFNEKNL